MFMSSSLVVDPRGIEGLLSCFPLDPSQDGTRQKNGAVLSLNLATVLFRTEFFFHEKT